MHHLKPYKFLQEASCVVAVGFSALFSTAHAQSFFSNQAGQYAVIGSLPGDQVAGQITFNSGNGWIVWQDNATDGNGLGIGARHLDNNLSGDLSNFRVNQIAIGDQQNPQVAMLKDGGAVFVWQGGANGFQKIYARFMAADGTFISSDVLVSSHANSQQVQPVVASLNNSNVVISWSSYGQDGSLFGVFSQLLSPLGEKIGSEFQVNQTSTRNQRTPVIAVLANGDFVVAWTTEKPNPLPNSRMQFVVNIFGRIFTESGDPVAAGEFAISSTTNFCSNPSISALAGGGFAAVWNQKNNVVISNGWDVFYRAFDSAGVSLNPNPLLVNAQLYGDQVSPKIAAHGTNVFVVWTSMGQDGSHEGIYGRNLNLNGSEMGSELRVNATTLGKQIQPSVNVDESGRFLVTWSSSVAGGSFDLFAQRYITDGSNGLLAPSAPYVSALGSTSLSVTWPDLAGFPVAFYDLFVDGSSTPISVNGIQATITNLLPGSLHTFQLLYQLTDGQRSPLSTATTGTTWGADSNLDGLPDDWQAAQWGNNPAVWPAPTVDSDGDGANNMLEFLAGTDPKDAQSVLRTRLIRTQQGFQFSWNTQPGLIYQVQSAVNLNVWQNVGSPRFAHGSTDSINLGKNNANTFYRVIRLR